MIVKLKQILAKLAELMRPKLGYRFPRLGRIANNLFFKLMPTGIETELFPQIRITLDLTDSTQQTTYWQGSRFEKPTPQVLAEWGKKATVFFDIGANYGFYSYWMVSRCPHLFIHAFEPNRKNYDILRSTKKINDLYQLHPYLLGLSNKKESIPLHIAKDDSGHSTFGNHPLLTDSPTTQVQLMPFDVWVDEQNMSRPDSPSWIAKIDVEGFEPGVLQGMEQSLMSKAFIGLIVEINPYTLKFCNAEPEDIFRVLNKSGYKIAKQSPIHRENYNAESGNAFFIPK